MSQTVYLHIGAPKTGTTYVQDRLARNASALAAHDVHFPTKSPLISPGLFQFRAALDLLGQDWGGEPGHAVGSWDALVKKVKRRSGTVLISHEILSAARSHQVARAMNDLAGAEVHVVYTARDLARQLPAAWQESIKQGRTWRYSRFLRKSQRGKTWFSRAFDLPTVLGTWGSHIPPEHIHLVTVPTRGGPESLWDRFCRASGLEPGWAPAESTRANESLGIAETTVLRQLNKRLDRKTRRESAYDGLIRQMLAEEALVRSKSPRIALPPTAYDWVEELSHQWLEWIEQARVDVVGDVADLIPTRPAADEPWHDPDRVRSGQRLAVAMAALAAMTSEAASRPDPEQQLGARVRKSADRLRLR